MSHFDYVLLVVVAISAFLGAFRGFLRECIAIAAWIIGIWLAWSHQNLVDPYLGGALTQEPIHTWVARAIILLAVLLIGVVIGAVVKNFVRSSVFSGFDRLLGFVFGSLRGLLILAVLGLLGQQLHLNHEKWWTSCTLMPYVEGLAGLLRSATGDRLAIPGKGEN